MALGGICYMHWLAFIMLTGQVQQFASMTISNCEMHLTQVFNWSHFYLHNKHIHVCMSNTCSILNIINKQYRFFPYNTHNNTYNSTFCVCVWSFNNTSDLLALKSIGYHENLYQLSLSLFAHIQCPKFCCGPPSWK